MKKEIFSCSNFQTQFPCFSCKFSPFVRNRFLCATSKHFGFSNSGIAYLIDIIPLGKHDFSFSIVSEISLSEACLVCTFSEENKDMVLLGSSKGNIHFWDSHQQKVVMVHKVHSSDISSIDCSVVEPNMICSASWDSTVRVFDSFLGFNSSYLIDKIHKGNCYSAMFSPHAAKVIASVGSSGLLAISDLRQENSSVLGVVAHASEILTVDWNKYQNCVLLTGSVDRSVKFWDVRNLSTFISQVPDSHDLAVRRAKFSPHRRDEWVSCSYDMTVNLWSSQQRIARLENHSEFVMDVDYDIFDPTIFISVGWDKQVVVHKNSNN